jgi:hypothetical protein
MRTVTVSVSPSGLVFSFFFFSLSSSVGLSLPSLSRSHSLTHRRDVERKDEDDAEGGKPGDARDDGHNDGLARAAVLAEQKHSHDQKEYQVDTQNCGRHLGPAVSLMVRDETDNTKDCQNSNGCRRGTRLPDRCPCFLLAGTATPSNGINNMGERKRQAEKRRLRDGGRGQEVNNKQRWQGRERDPGRGEKK